MLNPEILTELVTVKMPFGKYRDTPYVIFLSPILCGITKKAFQREN